MAANMAAWSSYNWINYCGTRLIKQLKLDILAFAFAGEHFPVMNK